jgi:hypothetical protein
MEKSPYEIYRDRVRELAGQLAPVPRDIKQELLWLKLTVIEKIERIDQLTKNPENKIYTFRADAETENGKFGFSEPYVDLLMHYAYEAGKQSVIDSYNQDTASMKSALNNIKNALENIGWIDYYEN